MKKIFLATDHAGFEYKNIVRDLIEREYKDQYEVIDYGAYTYEPLDDYPDYITKAARSVSNNPRERAIIFGGSGQGEATLANRFPNVRAVVYYGYDLDIIRASREHNDSNVLSIGQRFVKINDLEEVVRCWLSHKPNPDSKYQRRIEKAESVSVKKNWFTKFL